MITWDDVLLIAPGLSSLEEDSQDAILLHVQRLVAPAKWGDLLDMGMTFLAAHFGTLVQRSTATAGAGSSQAVGPVVSETVGPVARTFAVLTSGSGAGGDASLTSTNWGREYVELRRMLPSRFGQVL